MSWRMFSSFYNSSTDDSSRRNSESEEREQLESEENTFKMSIKQPPALIVNNDIDMSQEWAKWYRHYENFVAAAKITAESEEIQLATFNTVIGSDALDLIDTIGLSVADSQDLKKVILALNKHCAPKKNKVFERFKFHRIKQERNETFDNFLQRLREQLKHCGFADKNVDEFLVDQIVIGVDSDEIRQKLIIEDDLELEKTIKMCRASEQANKQNEELHKST